MGRCLKDQFKSEGILNEVIDYIKLHGASSASVYYKRDYIAMLNFCHDPEINQGDDGFGKNAIFNPTVDKDPFTLMAVAITERISQMAIKIETLEAENRELKAALQNNTINKERASLPAIFELLKACETT